MQQEKEVSSAHRHWNMNLGNIEKITAVSFCSCINNEIANVKWVIK